MKLTDELRCLLLAGLASIGLGSQPLHAQPAARVNGDFIGMLGPLHLKLHVTAASDGTLSGTLDSPDQGHVGIPCDDFRVQGDTFSFRVPSGKGTWTGKIADGGETLTGTWSQGSPRPLKFARDSFVPAAKPSAIDGIWLGTLATPAGPRRVQLTVKSDAGGHELCALDSLDQGIMGLSCANVSYAGQDLSFEVPALKGRWAGKLSADGRTLEGSWSQGVSLPLTLARQEKAVAPPPPRQPTSSPALAPADEARSAQH
jgi:hypothetical protein